MKFCSQIDYINQAAVEEEYPGAARIVEVDGGWMVFQTISDYQTWSNQQ